MKHLRGGVKKGAFDEATAQSKFEAWKQEKENKSAAIENPDKHIYGIQFHPEVRHSVYGNDILRNFCP